MVTADEDPGTASRPRGREEVEAAIVASATRLFAQNGPSKVTMQQIADDAGVNRGLLHRHFGSRDDIVQAVFGAVSRRATEAVAGPSLPQAMAEIRELSTGTHYGALLAWAILTDNTPVEGVPSAPMQALFDLAGAADGGPGATDGATDGDGVRVALATAFATSLGWQLYGQFLTENAGLTHLDPAELHRRVGDSITRTLTTDLRSAGVRTPESPATTPGDPQAPADSPTEHP